MRLALLLPAATLALAAQQPITSPTGPDASAYGAAEHYPLGSRATAFEQKYMVATFSRFDMLFPSHTVSPAEHVWDFQRPAAFAEIGYFHAGSRYTLTDYLARIPVTGLLIRRASSSWCKRP